MLITHDLVKRYGSQLALDGVSLEIGRGEFFGLLGPNGAGKSTFMSLVAGLRRPDAGALTLDGVAVTTADPSTRTALGLVPQSIALYEDLSAEQNLRVFGELYGLRGALLRERIDGSAGRGAVGRSAAGSGQEIFRWYAAPAQPRGVVAAPTQVAAL